MIIDFTLFGTGFAALFAMMNPIANTPVFLSLTSGIPSDEVRIIARKSLILSFLIVSLFAFSGDLILHVFGISISAFRIAGGGIVTLVGYHLLQGPSSPVHQPSQATLDDAKTRDAALSIAISPIAMPLLAGPGTIVTTINFTAQANVTSTLTIVTAFALICIITYLCFIGGEFLVKLVGKSILAVVSRLMGLILAVVGVQMLIEGIKSAFHLA